MSKDHLILKKRDDILIVNWHDSMPENFIVKMFTNAADLENLAISCTFFVIL
jgi:hypothetical protein